MNKCMIMDLKDIMDFRSKPEESISQGEDSMVDVNRINKLFITTKVWDAQVRK